MPTQSIVQEVVSTRALHPIPEARHILGGLGNSAFYEIVKRGDLKLTKIGRRSFVAADEIRRFVDSLKPDAST